MGVLGGDTLVGKTLDDRYVVLEIVGKGGMGIVYKARQKYLDREVALKVLRGEMASDATAVRRFMQEAKAASSLVSPNTVTIYAFGVTRTGLPYFAMELLKGIPLSRLIRTEKMLEWPRAVQFVIQVCNSLGEAHSRGIPHRDLKPENLFVTRSLDGQEFVKVLDFGIAKVGAVADSITAAGLVCGTPQYLSPEQGQGMKLDPRSDLYSLGVVLYEMLSGHPPFQGDTPAEVLLSHITKLPPPLMTEGQEFPAPLELQELVLRLLAKNRDERPSSAGELSAELKRILRRYPSAMRTTSHISEVTGPAPSRPLPDASIADPTTQPAKVTDDVPSTDMAAPIEALSETAAGEGESSDESGILASAPADEFLVAEAVEKSAPRRMLWIGLGLLAVLVVVTAIVGFMRW